MRFDIDDLKESILSFGLFIVGLMFILLFGGLWLMVCSLGVRP